MSLGLATSLSQTLRLYFVTVRPRLRIFALPSGGGCLARKVMRTGGANRSLWDRASDRARHELRMIEGLPMEKPVVAEVPGSDIVSAGMPWVAACHRLRRGPMGSVGIRFLRAVMDVVEAEEPGDHLPSVQMIRW